VTSPQTLIWYVLIGSALLNIVLYGILRERYLYGIMVLAIRLVQRDKNPVLCKIRAQPPIGPIEGVCNRMCKDYEKCERMKRR